MPYELKKIICNNNLTTVFQPIVSLQTGNVMGYEALIRAPKDSKYINTEMLFEDAKTYNLLCDLESLCVSDELKKFSSHNSDKLLFVNINPNILKNDQFIKNFNKSILEEYGISPMSIILEITEKTLIDDYESFNRVLVYYKSQGFKIAIDDVGTGYSGLTTIVNTRPYYIKIDMSLVTNISRDNFKKPMLKSLVEFANATNIKIIAEGIEDISDLYTLIEIGVHYGQGFLINKPSESLLETPEIIKKRIADKNFNLKKQILSASSNIKIGEIARHDIPILPTTTCNEIDMLFKNNPNIKGIPIVDTDSLILGIVMNHNFLTKVGTQYGWSIFMKRPVQLVMDSNPMIVDYHITLDKVSKIVLSREEDKLYDYLIVEKDKKYYGIITVFSLFEKTMEFELNIAKHSNPLTGLPGNIVIENYISKLIIDKKEFSLLYFDINDFKAFNDAYGFENGDRILLFTSNVIRKHIFIYKDSFLGHIGGDDFVAIISGDNPYNLCKNIIAEFDARISNFYKEDDKQNGYIYSLNRNNNKESYPIMSISIAVIINKNKSYSNIYELTQEAAKLKKKCKAESKEIMKSCFLIGSELQVNQLLSDG